jgi:hypothetical protein
MSRQKSQMESREGVLEAAEAATRAFERISELDLGEKTSKLRTWFGVKLKTLGSLRRTERIAAMHASTLPKFWPSLP